MIWWSSLSLILTHSYFFAIGLASRLRLLKHLSSTSSWTAATAGVLLDLHIVFWTLDLALSVDFGWVLRQTSSSVCMWYGLLRISVATHSECWRPLRILGKVIRTGPSGDDIHNVHRPWNPPTSSDIGAALDLTNSVWKGLVAVTLTLYCTQDCLTVEKMAPPLDFD